MLATDLNGTDWNYQSQYIHVWDSTDLRTFTGYRLLKVHSLATHAWAPEAYWDAGRGQYAVVYSAVTGGHNVLMVNYTSDFVTASAPQTFFDPGYDAIDGDFVSVNGVNYMYFKNNTNSTLLGARSTSLNPGSFTHPHRRHRPRPGRRGTADRQVPHREHLVPVGRHVEPQRPVLLLADHQRGRRHVEPARRPVVHPAAELQAPRDRADHVGRADRAHRRSGARRRGTG